MAAPRTGLPWSWGATEAEAAAAYPGDRHAVEGSERAIRAVDSAAPPSALFAWLKQLRAAPYSYDLVDNLGRRSPRTLTRPEPLEVGQRIAQIFELVEFEQDSHVVMVTGSSRGRRLFGRTVLSYHVEPRGQGSRLIGLLHVPYAGLTSTRPAMWLVMWGDLVMMRKQLRTLSHLAERS